MNNSSRLLLSCMLLALTGITAGCSLAPEYSRKKRCTKFADMPCFGYVPTCWQLWPDHCLPCPPPVDPQIVHEGPVIMEESEMGPVPTQQPTGPVPAQPPMGVVPSQPPMGPMLPAPQEPPLPEQVAPPEAPEPSGSIDAVPPIEDGQGQQHRPSNIHPVGYSQPHAAQGEYGDLTLPAPRGNFAPVVSLQQ